MLNKLMTKEKLYLILIQMILYEFVTDYVDNKILLFFSIVNILIHSNFKYVNVIFTVNVIDFFFSFGMSNAA